MTAEEAMEAMKTAGKAPRRLQAADGLTRAAQAAWASAAGDRRPAARAVAAAIAAARASGP